MQSIELAPYCDMQVEEVNSKWEDEPLVLYYKSGGGGGGGGNINTGGACTYV